MSSNKAEPPVVTISDGELSSSDEELNYSRKRRLGSRTPSPVVVNARVNKGNETDYGDFLIDRSESVAVTSNELSKDPNKEEKSDWMMKVSSEVLSPFSANTTAQGEPQQKRRRNGCFNCGGDHPVTNCPEPKDANRIREAQQARREQVRARTDNQRYHEDDKKVEKFRPGRISNSLRSALGIGTDDIPEWIYRMRKMGFIDGYPPGYLKQAIIKDTSHKLLSFHSIDGLGDYTPEDDGRESPPPQLDSNKMIYFMGFNQYYRSLKDRERFNVPPFNEFCDFHRDHLLKKHEDHIKQRRRDRERQKQKETKTNLNQDNEVITLDSAHSSDEDVIVLDGTVPTNIPITNEEESLKSPVTKEPKEEVISTPKGSIKSVVLRTPIPQRRNAAGEVAADEIPDLDKFKEGIIPFQVEEESTPHRGFLKKIVAKIKQVTGRK
ncbi:unnamed protein product [Auanema sp. JU1783]|nr:unnamed protein product [Auanema sp. JU1783]